MILFLLDIGLCKLRIISDCNKFSFLLINDYQNTITCKTFFKIENSEIEKKCTGNVFYLKW